MSKKESYNVMAVYDLTPWSGRDIFAGTLEEISNKRNWRLHVTRPGKFFTKNELVDDEGNGFDGFIISLPGNDAVMAEIAKSDIPTVLVNITDRRLAARAKAVSTVWLDKAIEDARMAEAQRRLKDDASVADIVKAMHFTSANQFYRIYKRHFGRTIRQTDA